ncbi:cell wall-binding repeat-containing protein [Clostridium ihumii]|uniref:cell wall-binding repeat-containing protein n=1 Tax=Clostridium ihumii TaxID=1470356 RepID=UPI003D32B5BD
MNSKLKCLIATTLLAVTTALPIVAKAQTNDRVLRIDGANRYETSINIAKQFVGNDMIDSVILASGKDYPDALTGSILSKKYNAPIILVDYDTKTSEEQLQFILSRLNPGGKVYLLGGKGAINNNFISYFKQNGFENVVRLGGKNRYETNEAIVKEAKVEEGTPIIIASSESFADALSISTVSGENGYPILLTPSNTLSESCKNQIETIKPTEIFIAGGTGAISSDVENEIETLTPQLHKSKIVRLGGNNRYDTSFEILKYFKGKTAKENIVIASGENFPDALSASALAIKTNSPILLSNSQSINDKKAELDSFKKVTIAGGKFTVDKFSERLLNGENEFTFIAKQAYEENGEKYIEGHFCKFSKDIKELEEYAKFYGTNSGVIQHPVYGPIVLDAGRDIRISDDVKLKVKDNVEVELVDWSSSDILNDKVPSDFYTLTDRDSISGRFTFNLKINNGKVESIIQQYRQ